jgi:hypothetical protein
MRVAVAVVLVLLAAGLAGCSKYDEAHAEVPEWKSGYTWQYQGSGSYAFSAQVDGEHFDDADTVGPLDNSARVLRSVDVAGVAAYLVLQDGGGGGLFLDFDELVAYRASDLATASVRARATTPCVGCASELSVQLEDDWFRLLDFPLSKGKSWTLAQDDVIPLPVHARVLGGTSVDTPAGKFDVVRTRFTLDIDEAEIARMIREDIEEEGGKVRSLDLDFDFHLDVDYAPRAKNVVMVSLVVTLSGSIVAEEDGEVHRAEGSLHADFRSQLVSYALEEVPPASIEEVLGKPLPPVSPPVEKPTTKPTSTTTTTGPGAPKFSITQDPAEINAAATPKVTWSADVVGGTPPYRHEWSITPPLGKRVEASGPTASLDAHAAGIYMVGLMTYDAKNRLAGFSYVQAPARHEASVEAACTLSVRLAGLGSCERAMVQVGTGVAKVTVSASAEAGLLGDGQLQIKQGVVVLASANMVGGKATIEIEPEWSQLGEWTIEQLPPTGPASSVTYEILAEPRPTT